MKVNQLPDAQALARFADQDAPTLHTQLGFTIPEVADKFLAFHSLGTLPRSTVENYITAHCGLG
ncbi:MAG: hypothetical protein AAB424_03790 [Patescibacteria group bacterium]